MTGFTNLLWSHMLSKSSRGAGKGTPKRQTIHGEVRTPAAEDVTMWEKTRNTMDTWFVDVD